MASGFPRDRKRVASAIARCHECQRRILWATLASGTRVPLDPAPDPDGTVYVLQHGAVWRVGVPIRDLGLAAETRANGHPLHSFHQDTCPSRRPRARADLA